MCARDSLERLTGNPACAEGEPGNEGDSIAFAITDNVVPFTVGKAVTVLHRNDGHDFARTLDVFLRDVGQSHKPNLSFLFQFGQGSH